MSYHKINITLQFNDIEELEEFTKDYRGILHKRAKKLFKCDDDKRGRLVLRRTYIRKQKNIKLVTLKPLIKIVYAFALLEKN